MSNIRVNIYNNDQDSLIYYTNNYTNISTNNYSIINTNNYTTNVGDWNARNLFTALGMNSLFEDTNEDTQLNDALRESEESNIIERKKIKLKIDYQRYDAVCTDETTCGICQDDFEADDTVSLLTCKHVFHEKCITEWGKFKPNCAVCRTAIDHIES
jgi:hypothetical protein